MMNRSFVADQHNGGGSDSESSAIMASLDPVNINDDDDYRNINCGGSHNNIPSTKSGVNNLSVHSTLPDVLSSDLTSLALDGGGDEDGQEGFLLLDERENLRVESADDFALKLGFNDPSIKAKVVSVIGNTGEGKSHTLNHSLFEGRAVFKTSQTQEAGTVGIWAAFQPGLSSGGGASTTPLVVLDTEGMLGTSKNENQRTRLLLKVLAISDIVIYRTRAERLHNDLFYFLGDASKAYNKHFAEELKKVYSYNPGSEGESAADSGINNVSLGPSVIICHQTTYTDVLGGGATAVTSDEGDFDRQGRGHSSPAAESALRQRISSLGQDVTAFSKLKYFGYKSCDIGGGGNSTSSEMTGPSEHHLRLRDFLIREADDNSLRSSRQLALIFKTLQALTTKFSSSLAPSHHRSFPDEYFTCQAKCSACESRCDLSINHEKALVNGERQHHTIQQIHKSDTTCVYQRRLDNKVYLCLRCYHNGRRVVVVPKASESSEGTFMSLASYAWSGFVLECLTCGVIYRSRANWYANESPENSSVVQTEIAHIWPGTRTLQGTQNAGRRLLDGVSLLSDTVSSLSAAPAKTITRWAADQIAPDYWRPNSEITNCHGCRSKFSPTTSKIHHCRACGEGFCDKCSDYSRPVPDRGWGMEPVRVCKRCYTAYRSEDSTAGVGDKDVQARKVGERVIGALGALTTTVLDYPVSALKESARPDYWVPDDELKECCVCGSDFDAKLRFHHCRSCGDGVCDPCSKTRRPVPIRGWDHPVRVCDNCQKT